MTAPGHRRVDHVLVANRGEIARRIVRTCRRLGVRTTVVCSDADLDAPYVGEADHAIRLPGSAASDTYLRGDLLIGAAVSAGADAIHPGYGFLSENAAFARAVADAGLVLIGPPASAIEAMGSKIEAKHLMRAAGVPVLPDSETHQLAAIGLPALVKASAGGGGRGMRIVGEASELDDAVAAAQREAIAAFADGAVFVERYVEGARHVEIQVMADTHGNTVALFERDCTLQRRHQKIIEESPSPAVDDALRHAMSEAAVAAAAAVGYVGAGTVEFLLDRDGAFFFLEMNTRLQVEHPVTEMITGLDLVELQLTIATGEPLPHGALHAVRDGHAIEARLCAEDPANGYRPSAGRFVQFDLEPAEGVRVDSGVEAGSVVSPFYDSMIAKVIAHGPTRAIAVRRLSAALARARIVGPTTNREQLLWLLGQLEQVDDVVDTGWLDRTPMPASTPVTQTQLAVAVVALVDRDAAARPVLAAIPAGWRNNPSQPHETRLVDSAGSERVVHHRHLRTGAVGEIAVDGDAVDVDEVRALVRLRPPVVVDDTVHLDGGRIAVRVVPRFVAPDAAGRAGSLLAPMPGVVLRVLVAVGEEVVAGQPIVIIEAMKMEHRVTSPGAGLVAEVLVTAGQQVDSGRPLVRIDDAPASPVPVS